MNKALWEECVTFHGHACPGLAIGFRACEIAKEKMDLTFAPDEELVCVTENEACGVDAIQYMTGCTLGKGNLIYRDTGKMAFTFFSRRTGESLRIVLRPAKEEMTREQRQAFILEAPMDEVFQVKKPHYELPVKAKIFTTIVCEACQEPAPEHKIRLNDGKKVCMDCAPTYSRGWA
jgi:formylmethanofuran dehydrogenase subunit E